MEIEKFDLIEHTGLNREACRFLMPISGGAPDDDEKDDDDAGEDDDGKTDDKEKDDDDVTKALEEAGLKDKKDEDDDAELDPKDDVELNLGKKLKAKVSDILAWRKANGQLEGFTKKSQGLAQKERELKALIDMNNFLRANPKKLERVLAIIEEADDAAEAAREEGGDKKDEAAAIKAVMDKLDMTIPTNVLLKHVFEGQLKLLKEVDSAKKLDRQTVEQRQAVAIQQQTKVAQKILGDTFTESFKEFEVKDESDQTLIRQLTLSFLKDNPKDYEDDADFTGTIKNTVKKMKVVVDKIGERRLAAYLKKKGGSRIPTGGDGGDGSPRSAGKKDKAFDNDNLQDTIEAALEEIQVGA